MPQAPAVIGDLAAFALGRPAWVVRLSEPAPGFLEVVLQAGPPPGGWFPGHEIQFRISRTAGRRYTVRTVTGNHITILIATAAAGPGTTWIRDLRPGDETTVLTGRHRHQPEPGTRRLYLGDGCTLGTLEARTRQVPHDHIVTVEVPPDAVAPFQARRPDYHFLPAGPAPGDTLQSWLDQADLHALDGAVLLGHAQSLQRQRRTLIARGLPRRAITTRPYWATGKAGL